MLRRPAVAGPRLGDAAAALPSILLPVPLLALAPSAGEWPAAATAAFAAGALWAAASVAALARSFAVLPAAREVVVRGPYRWMRHPVYLGELAMLGGCAAARGDALAALVAGFALPLVALRIAAEERALAALPGHAAYVARVPWRLVPRIW